MRTSWSPFSVVYHVYVRSFKDSNNDGIGDLEGLISKLDYLNDGTENSLGIDAIWLSPIYSSPNADFGYDISDYKNINPEYGDLDIFKRLVEEAHNRGIKILMDFVPNHTSDEHPWFIESRSSRDNSKRDYYIWKDPKEDGSPPNNWISTFSTSAWEYDQNTDQYYLHTFNKKQPDLNWRNPEVVKEMLDNLRFWLDIGIDGFRVDVPEWMFKDEQFRDEPLNSEFNPDWPDKYGSLIHIYTIGLPESIQMLIRFMEVLGGYEDKFMVVETWSKLQKIIEMYTIVSMKLFAPFNFCLIELPWSARDHREYINEYDRSVSDQYYPTYVLGNHDKARVASRIGRENIRVAAILEMTLRGIPFIYYGEEIGMENGQIPQDKIKDPIENIISGIGLGRDPERTPMQWNNEENSSFSTIEPWLPVAQNYRDINAEKESLEKESILSLYKLLISLRKTETALQLGNYSSIDLGNDQLFAFMRAYNEEKILVVLNYGDWETYTSLNFSRGKILCDSKMTGNDNEVDLSNLRLDGKQGLVIKVIS